MVSTPFQGVPPARNSANNWAAIEIAEWGPPDLKGEVRSVPGFDLIGERRPRPVLNLRVRYCRQGLDEKLHRKDRLFTSRMKRYSAPTRTFIAIPGSTCSGRSRGTRIVAAEMHESPFALRLPDPLWRPLG